MAAVTTTAYLSPLRSPSPLKLIVTPLVPMATAVPPAVTAVGPLTSLPVEVETVISGEAAHSPPLVTSTR